MELCCNLSLEYLVTIEMGSILFILDVIPIILGVFTRTKLDELVLNGLHFDHGQL